MYYPLHVHTAIGSIGDSTLRIKDYVLRGKEYGLDSLAVTDHGSMSAMYTFAKECKEHGITPVIGMEAYEVDDADIKDKEQRFNYNHLVLLAKNNTGLKNLLKIHNDAQIRGFYYKPRTDMNALKRWGRGIIALSACIAGTIPQAILNGDDKKAIEKISFYKECFDEFYLEIQPGGFKEQIEVNDGIIELSRITNTPIVVTNDIHYLGRDDYLVHDYHVKLGRNKDKEKIPEGMVYPDKCYWFMKDVFIESAFHYTDKVTLNMVRQGMRNADKIIHSCRTEIESGVQMPKFDCEDEQAELYSRCYEKLNEIIQSVPNPEEYTDRLEKELKVITDKGFCGYFLVVQDYCQWARGNGVNIAYARGSASGSLVTYLLGISAPDPIYYRLLFERFLDPHREAIPDIDVDMGSAGREKVFQYVVDKYGFEHCAQISAIHIRKAKGAIKDAARILGLPVNLANEISRLIPTVFYGDDGEKQKDLSIDESCDKIPELKKFRNKYPELFNLATSLEGLPSSTSIHAAGVAISPRNLMDTVPLIRSNREGLLATSLTLEDAEEQLVKFDFLGLDTIDVVCNTERELGLKFNNRDVESYNDEDVWSVIGSKYTTGVFQLGSSVYKQRMPRLKPTSISELSACLALVRGPSISAKADETYMNIVEGKSKIKKIHPIYDEITKDTNGILLYQEQVMRLAVAVGMDLSTGYKIVKLSAKKKHEELLKYKEEFIRLAIEKGCSKKIAQDMFKLIELSAEYSFNMSHSVSYAMLAYESAWLKYHYTAEFMKQLLSNKFINGKKTEYAAVIKDSIDCGLKLLPPDINKSEWEFSIEDGDIRLGLCAIKGLGDKAAAHLLEKRKEIGGEFDGIAQFIDSTEKRKFNKSKVIVGIFSGLFDSLIGKKESRRSIYEWYCKTYLNEEPLDLITVTKDFQIDTKSKAKKTLEKLFFGAAISTTERGKKK